MSESEGVQADGWLLCCTFNCDLSFLFFQWNYAECVPTGRVRKAADVYIRIIGSGRELLYIPDCLLTIFITIFHASSHTPTHTPCKMKAMWQDCWDNVTCNLVWCRKTTCQVGNMAFDDSPLHLCAQSSGLTVVWPLLQVYALIKKMN